MAEIAYTGQVTPDRLQQVVAHCHFTQDALFLAERLPTRLVASQQEREDLLPFTYFNDDLSYTAYTSGRIFQEDRELRWEKQGNILRVVYVGPEENEAALRDDQLRYNDAFDAFIKKPEPTYYYLFGERLRQKDPRQPDKGPMPGDFAVLRIPRILRYPVPRNNDRYVRLAVCEYLETKTGQVALFRFQRLETWSGKE